MSINELRKELKKLGNKEKANFLQGFFKTGPGEYGEGDIFLGIRVPVLRKLSTKYKGIRFKEVKELLKSDFHEERLLSLFILIKQYSKGSESDKKKIYNLYLKNIKYINNWDLVDCSAHYIVGDYLRDKSRKPIYDLAKSGNLWKRRISVIATFWYINENDFSDSLKLSKLLLRDEEDLIHKAVGWMLREIGKSHLESEEKFLRKNYKSMPRTMLRYAIERFPEQKRQKYLKGKI